MSKSLFIFILSFAIAIQPVAFYPSKAYAQPAVEATKFSTLYKKIVDAKGSFIRNKVFGETPGSNPSLAPSSSYIESLDRELQGEKDALFSSVRKTLANPTLIPNQETDKAPIEWDQLAEFYQAAAEMEHLKALNGTLPDPAAWKQKYEFKVQAQDVVDPFFANTVSLYMNKFRKEDSSKFPLYVKFISNSLEDNYYEFQLNPLLAVGFAEKQMAVASSNDQMMRMAQLTAANQLYENQLMIHSLNRHELNSVPDVPANLREKFPILQWKRDNYILTNEIQDQHALIENLAEKKVGALVEKLAKEDLFFFDKLTVFKILNAVNPTKNVDINAANIQAVLDDIREFEQSPIFISHLQALLFETSFKLSQAKAFWTQNIKLTITQAKLAVAQGFTLNSEGMSDDIRQKIHAILNERKESYLNETLRALNVTPIVKHVKDEQTYLMELRQDFQRKLWINAKRMESSLLVENDPVDLTVIADKSFIDHLNNNLNKEEIQFKAQPDKGIRADKGIVINPIQPLTAQWLQTIFQPNQSYGVLKEAYKTTIFDAIKDFKFENKKAPEGGFDPFGTATEPDIKAIETWLKGSTYNKDAVKLSKNPLNSIALNLNERAPEARKQELLELIKIGQNLGFFLKHDIGETPKVSQMPWSPAWTKAYHAVIQKRIIVENPLLAMKLSDTEHESAWESVAYSPARLYNYVLGKGHEEKSLWQELAPLYTNEMETTDERADALVTTYLNKMQELIIKDLQYVGEEGAKAEVSWNPLSWHLIGRNKPYEFSSQFKKIVARSSILTVKLHQFSHFQSQLLKLQQDLEYDSAESKAYEHVFNYYVMYGFMASILFGVAGQVAKRLNPKKGFELFQLFEKEALFPVLGPGLKYYNNSALIWMGLDMAGSAVNTFGTQRDLRDRTSDLAFASVNGPGLIDLNMKNLSDGFYNNVHMKWWTQAAVLIGIGVVIGGYRPAINGVKYVISRAKGIQTKAVAVKTDELSPEMTRWAEKMTRWADNVGFQKTPKADEYHVGLLKGDIEAMAETSRTQVTARSKKIEWANAEVLTANINISAQLLEQEVASIAAYWASRGQKFSYQFKSLHIPEGQWDILLLNKRMKEIELALSKKQITREQAWVLKKNLAELQDEFKPFADTMLKIPGIGAAVLERVATATSRIQFSSTGRIMGYEGARLPETWWQQMKTLRDFYPNQEHAFFVFMEDFRAMMLNIKWVKDPGTQLVVPVRQTLYDIESKRKLIEAYERAIK